MKLLIEVDLDEEEVELYRGQNAAVMLMDIIKEALPGILKQPDLRAMVLPGEKFFCLYEAGTKRDEMAVRVMVLNEGFIRERQSKDGPNTRSNEVLMEFVEGGR